MILKTASPNSKEELEALEKEMNDVLTNSKVIKVLSVRPGEEVNMLELHDD